MRILMIAVAMLLACGSADPARWWCGDRACYRDRSECMQAHGSQCSGARLAFCPIHIGGLTCAPSLERCQQRIREDLAAGRDHASITPLGAASAYCVGVE